MSDLFMVLGEGAGPSVVVDALTEGMQKSKVPVQQKAAVSILLRLVNEFGAFSLDLKVLFAYIKSDQCLLNSHVEVKNQAVELLRVLYQQLGAVVRSLIEQSGISDLLKKTVMDALDGVAFDATAAAAYASRPVASAAAATAQAGQLTPSVQTAAVQTAAAPQTVSLQDLIEKQDITAEAGPLLKKLAATEGKEAWKERQQGVLELTALLKKKVRVENNAAMGEVMIALKNRLGETNLNLRAKVLLCLSQAAEALGGEVTQYSASVLSEALKLATDSNKNVSEALYALLGHWVEHQDGRTAAYLSPVLPLCAPALKQSKSRAPFLRWLTPLLPLCDSRALQPLLGELLSCALDKAKDVRALITPLLPALCQKCGRLLVEQCYAGRKPAEVASLKAVLDPILANCPDKAQPARHAAPAVAAPVAAVVVAEKEKEAGETKLTTERRAALANRPGARVLAKRSTTASLKRSAVSSIPKALPPLKQRMRNEREAAQALAMPPVQTEAPVVAVETVQVEQTVQPEEVELEKPVPEAALRCAGWCEALETQKETLLTQRELAQFGCSLEARGGVLFAGEVMDALWRLLRALAEPCVDVRREHTAEYNGAIEALGRLCCVLDDVAFHSLHNA